MIPSAPHSPSNAKLTHLSPYEAYEMVQTKDVAFIDIRAEIEHFFVGSPPGVINVPWQDAPDYELNPDFLKEMLLVARKDQIIILLCRSGHRSIDAGNFLIENGFKKVYHVDEGFEGDRDKNHHRSSVNGWRFHKLPWVQC
ncbi:MAG: rhodanese-like domain-containing protein [Magnetococcales bacterium]|nr:rhodanese-like domain-containing protein [Magnetococcales bacterium]